MALAVAYAATMGLTRSYRSKWVAVARNSGRGSGAVTGADYAGGAGADVGGAAAVPVASAHAVPADQTRDRQPDIRSRPEMPHPEEEPADQEVVAANVQWHPLAGAQEGPKGSAVEAIAVAQGA